MFQLPLPIKADLQLHWGVLWAEEHSRAPVSNHFIQSHSVRTCRQQGGRAEWRSAQEVSIVSPSVERGARRE